MNSATATQRSTHPQWCDTFRFIERPTRAAAIRREPEAAPDDGIDAVVTWVDGTDPAHRAKLDRFLGALGRVPEIASADRYRETGEFAYCIASLLRFAPWLRRIWIVTDAQEPAFMPALRASPWREKVSLVDHAVLFAGYERNLPTFNNRSLLSALWRIPGLSSRFLYLNDDFAMLRPVEPEDFFRDGKVVLRGCWRPQRWGFGAARLFRAVLDRAGWLPRRAEPRPGYHQAQALAARLAGYRWRYFRVPHAPHPQLRAPATEFFRRHPEHFEANIRHRLRSPAQFLADALGNHLALREGRAIVDNRLRTLRLKREHYAAPFLERALAVATGDARTAFLCLQDLESIAPERRGTVFRWLDAMIGRPEALFHGETARLVARAV
jgi:hypothetical protein